MVCSQLSQYHLRQHAGSVISWSYTSPDRLRQSMHFHWSFWHLSHCRDFTLSVIMIPHRDHDPTSTTGWQGSSCFWFVGGTSRCTGDWWVYFSVSSRPYPSSGSWCSLSRCCNGRGSSFDHGSYRCSSSIRSKLIQQGFQPVHIQHPRWWPGVAGSLRCWKLGILEEQWRIAKSTYNSQ